MRCRREAWELASGSLVIKGDNVADDLGSNAAQPAANCAEKSRDLFVHVYQVHANWRKKSCCFFAHVFLTDENWRKKKMVKEEGNRAGKFFYLCL